MMRHDSFRFAPTARWAFAAAVLVCAGVVQAAGKLELAGSVYQDVEVVSPQGVAEMKRVPAARVVPGGEVVYEITYVNSGDEPVTNVAIDNPVPPQLVFVDVEGAALTAVSVDGGGTYGALPELVVSEANGETRPAQPADVTHLRWILGEVPPARSGKVGFKARVK